MVNCKQNCITLLQGEILCVCCVVRKINKLGRLEVFESFQVGEHGVQRCILNVNVRPHSGLGRTSDPGFQFDETLQLVGTRYHVITPCTAC